MTVKTPTLLVIYDFDWSFVDQDSDEYLFECLSPALRQSLQDSYYEPDAVWADTLARHLVLLHKAGFTRQDIVSTLQGVPLHPAMKRAVTNLKARSPPSTTFFCCSAANTEFIDIILKHHGLENLFAEVVSNAAEWEGDLLKVTARVTETDPPHGCTLPCARDMCKGESFAVLEMESWLTAFRTAGKEIDEFMARHGGWEAWDRIAYVGDGSNDFCPILRLRSQDIAFVRSERGLEKIVDGPKGEAIKATVKKWDQAWRLEQMFEQL
ncbi:hypothetical protein MNV49_002441 [Pseudohyphozyma bogoriensis]|nr:hypothetical protein MNV49_002441 [Pseudohyphozyma bogoriensis]